MLHQKRSSPHQKNQIFKGNWVLLIGLELRMFCTRSRSHTSRPTGHDDAICEVVEARREFLVIIHVMPHQASSKAQQSSSKKSEFQRKLGALNRTRTTDVLHPK
jgi:hypothetical protein